MRCCSTKARRHAVRRERRLDVGRTGLSKKTRRGTVGGSSSSSCQSSTPRGRCATTIRPVRARDRHRPYRPSPRRQRRHGAVERDADELHRLVVARPLDADRDESLPGATRAARADARPAQTSGPRPTGMRRPSAPRQEREPARPRRASSASADAEVVRPSRRPDRRRSRPPRRRRRHPSGDQAGAQARGTRSSRRPVRARDQRGRSAQVRSRRSRAGTGTGRPSATTAGTGPATRRWDEQPRGRGLGPRQHRDDRRPRRARSSTRDPMPTGCCPAVTAR